jgi:hypothetical protein
MFEAALLVDPVDRFPDLVAAIDAVPPRASRGGTAAECDLRLRSLLVLARRVQGLLLAEVAAFDDQGFAPALGAASTGSYLAAHAHLDPHAARHMVTAARTADRLPQLGAMLAAGDVAVDHVAAVGFSTRRLPTDVVAAEDATFASLAGSGRPSDLRAAGAHLQALYDTDATSRDARHLHDSRYLTLAQTLHGAWHLQGLLTPEDGTALSLALDSLSTKNNAEDDRNIAQRRADALIELAALAMRAGELPDTGGDQPRVTLLVQSRPAPFTHPGDAKDDVESDQTDPVGDGGDPTVGNGFSVTGFDLADAELLASTALISPETLQRICCDAELNVATYDATGNLLNLGRATRFPNLTQRRAIKIRDRHCVFPGCDTPAHRCAAHHIDYWSQGGPTDLTNLALICAFHHYLIHDKHWKLAKDPPSSQHPTGGWIATAPNGYQLRQAGEDPA